MSSNQLGASGAEFSLMGVGLTVSFRAAYHGYMRRDLILIAAILCLPSCTRWVSINDGGGADSAGECDGGSVCTPIDGDDHTSSPAQDGSRDVDIGQQNEDADKGCQPDCLGRQCGPDGCGASCPPGCDAPDFCDTSSGLCISCETSGAEQCGNCIDEDCDGDTDACGLFSITFNPPEPRAGENVRVRGGYTNTESIECMELDCVQQGVHLTTSSNGDSCIGGACTYSIVVTPIVSDELVCSLLVDRDFTDGLGCNLEPDTSVVCASVHVQP